MIRIPSVFIDYVYGFLTAVTCDRNLLLNVGPTVDGVILPAFQEKLLQMGAWLEVRGQFYRWEIFGEICIPRQLLCLSH